MNTGKCKEFWLVYKDQSKKVVRSSFPIEATINPTDLQNVINGLT